MLSSAEPGPSLDREAFEALGPTLRLDLINLQFDVRESRRPVLIMLEGDDRAGCEGVVDRLQEWMDGRHVTTRVFRKPDPYLRERPWMWRFWQSLPPRGRSAVFLNGWALQSIASRLRGEIDDVALDRQLDHARVLENMLARDGTVLVKIWLHLSHEEHAERVRLAAEGKRSARYVDGGHVLTFERYHDVVEAGERALVATHTPTAPWLVIRSGDARYRDVAVARAIRDRIAEALAGRDGAVDSKPAFVSVAEPEARRLDGVDLSVAVGRDEYVSRRAKLQDRLNGLARRMRRRGGTTVLVFEGWDGAGKGGAIRRVTQAMSALDYDVIPIAAPTDEESGHHYLWRFWRHIPRAGRIVIFDRSWYGRVLVERVEGFARDDEWQRAYAEINDFEAQLIEHGCAFAKFWLHIDRDEQRRRFEARRKTGYKKYKITDEDERNRARWPDYAQAVEDMVARTDTGVAPWTLVAANDKPAARLQVLEVVCDVVSRAYDVLKARKSKAGRRAK